MALIDVTELFTDPDFVDDMSIITRSPVVNTLGENILKEAIEMTVGSVQPADKDMVERLPDALRTKNMSSFWTKGRIIASDKCKYPSIIEFRGSRYQVIHIENWSNWGEGWIQGICVAERPS